MPPKAKKEKTNKTEASFKTPTPPRRAKLAKANELSLEDESAIYEGWRVYSEQGVENFESEKDGVCPTNKIRSVFKVLNLEPKSRKDMDEFLEILDPESDGYVTYSHFLELAAIQMNSKSEDTKAEEVDKAFRLFTHGQSRPITYQDLRRTANLLTQEVSDDVLRAMIVRANGGQDVSAGVDRDQFQQVMSRAGVFS